MVFKPRCPTRVSTLSIYIHSMCRGFSNSNKKRKKIKGISIEGDEIKISQYEDDTTLFLDGSKALLQESLRVLDRFSQISGLKLNVTKTEVLWFGSLSGKTDVLFPERKLKWTTNIVIACTAGAPVCVFVSLSLPAANVTCPHRL